MKIKQISRVLFRIGFLSDVIAGILFLLAVWASYVLLKPVDQNIALLFLLINLDGDAVQCINMLNLFAAGLLLNGADFLKVFQSEQLNAFVMFFSSSAAGFVGEFSLACGF